ncbi:STAS domain-containing protein [Exilibacterium tricleocarpae]|uniref:Anti-sigma factor antagonist n=1 Tax=Exilibacterium tricleocarpae TaxID=2591008 RepID=A0A545U9E5_9GAMM|nr:STAS domain-containing protein [Exilibacterium tricleocarpae]TQV86094.1 STAS domain-containing protein [Exilibacterium tricleocarpae]
MYETSEHLHYRVLHLQGEVDLNNSPKLRDEVLSILEQGQSLLVDFTSLTYIDSSGIATLVEGLNVSKGKDLQFAIIGASGSPLQVLQLTRLDQVFPLAATLDDVRE